MALFKTSSGPLAFTHVRAFLAGDHFAEDQTVVVDRGRDHAGRARPHGSPRRPARRSSRATARPWCRDCGIPTCTSRTMAGGPALLSLGITSVRDPGNNNALTLARAARRARGETAEARGVYASVLIDGQGRQHRAGGERREFARGSAGHCRRKAKSDGFHRRQGLYGTLNPAWVRGAGRRSARAGLACSRSSAGGNAPVRRPSTTAMTRITHIYFVDDAGRCPMMWWPSPTAMARFLGPGKYAKGRQARRRADENP